MRSRLQPVMQQAGSSNKKLGLFREFVDKDVEEGMVFTDGTKQTQAMPSTSGSPGLWWPVLVTAESVGKLGDGTTIAVWCQAQAVNGSRPYGTHPSRVCVFLPHDSHHPSFSTTTVRITEISSDGDSFVETDGEFEEDWVLAN